MSGASDDDGHPFAIGLSTSDDNADDALSLVYNEDSNTYTYVHTDLPDSSIYVYGVDLGADLALTMTCLLLGWGITSTPQLPRHKLNSRRNPAWHGGVSLSYAVAEPAAGPAIQSATEDLLVAVLRPHISLMGQ